MTDSSSARILHVANGTCTTRLIEAAGIPGRRSIWADPLYEGPVPGGVSDEELLAIRARYLVEALPRMHEGEDAYHITDLSLMQMVQQLSSTAVPLLAPAGAIGTATLTDAGRAVLAGGQDRIEATGIDRWLGGVYMKSGVSVWRWDDDAGRVTRSRS